ncbi:MAG: endolytic transglycosylase MltG [Stackebrandtia sp.]
MLDERSFEANDAAKPRGHRRRKRGRTGFTLLLVFVLLATVGVVGFFGFDKVKSFFTAPDYEGDGNGVAVEVEIAEGSNIGQMGDALHKKDVVKSSGAFVNAAEANPKSNAIGPGTYALEEQMSGEAALDRMLDPKSRKVSGVTIREGLTQWGTFKKLSKATGIDIGDFEAAAKDPEALGVPSDWFEREDGKDVEKSIEGFLFPASYEIKKNAGAEGILKQMVTKFLEVSEAAGFKETVAKQREGYSPYEALIVASLSQAEAGVEKDLGKISRVAYNRLETPDNQAYFCDGDPGTHCLQYDTTTNYGLMEAGKPSKNSKDLTDKELYDPKNKWSTHAHSGLPPTPINNPGKTSLEGAANPPEGDWVFFVAVDKEGNSEFAATAEEHAKNKEKAKKNGVL